MAKKLEVLYPGKTDVDANNQFGTFKNRTSDALKDGTPYEKGWASDVWGFLAHILKKAVVIPSGAEENETVSQYYDALEGLVGRRAVQAESKNLVIELLSVTQVKADAARLSTLDSSFIPTFIDDLDITFEIPTDLMAGTSEKASTWYQMWIDKDLVQLLVPDLTGTADGTAAGFLVDSANTFATDLVKAGDKIRNRTDGTETTVSVTPTVDGNNLAVTDDIFVSGELYEIRLLSPTGIDESKTLLGQAFNDGSSNFTKVEEYGQARITESSWHTVNGYGSTNNKIQKFVTEVIPSNDIVVTVVNDATDGFSITANMPCTLNISYDSSFNAADVFAGISKSSTQLTTAIQSITTADRKALGVNVTANRALLNSWPGTMAVGDVVRPHTDGTADGVAANGAIHIVATEIT